MPTVCPKHGNVERNKWGQCPNCARESCQRYALTTRGKVYKAARNKRYTSAIKGKLARKRRYEQNPEVKFRQQARGAVLYAIHTGKLIKLPCQVCGNPKSEAHHYLGYSKEHRLDVVFLCRAHHVIADEEIKSSAPVE